MMHVDVLFFFPPLSEEVEENSTEAVGFVPSRRIPFKQLDKDGLLSHFAEAAPACDGPPSTFTRAGCHIAPPPTKAGQQRPFCISSHRVGLLCLSVSASLEASLGFWLAGVLMWARRRPGTGAGLERHE